MTASSSVTGKEHPLYSKKRPHRSLSRGRGANEPQVMEQTLVRPGVPSNRALFPNASGLVTDDLMWSLSVSYDPEPLRE
jgi:hypothetical protein